MNVYRRIYVVIAAVLVAWSAGAQTAPRAIGLRGGPCLELSYQHQVGAISFIDLSLGLDFGDFNPRNANTLGYKAECTYDFLFARPRWTRGEWGFFAGPGLALGYVDDPVPFQFPDGVIREYPDMGFMLGAVLNFGLEYTFWFPLQLSVDIRPVVGFHVNDGLVEGGERLGSRFGFYRNGLYQLIPSLSVRYVF